MKKLFLVTIISNLFIGFSFSQKKESDKRSPTYDESYVHRISEPPRGTVAEMRRGKGALKGSPYISEDFIATKVADSIYLMRYNAYADVFEQYETVGGHVVPFAASSGAKFEIPSLKKTYQFLNYKEKNTVKQGFLVLLYESDDLKLYKREKINFNLGQAPRTSYDRAFPDEFERQRDVFYYQIHQTGIVELPRKKSQFLNLFDERKGEINSFMKENKISLREENDLIRLFRFINQ